MRQYKCKNNSGNEHVYFYIFISNILTDTNKLKKKIIIILADKVQRKIITLTE